MVPAVSKDTVLGTGWSTQEEEEGATRGFAQEELRMNRVEKRGKWWSVGAR